jgi:hypothetical protein
LLESLFSHSINSDFISSLDFDETTSRHPSDACRKTIFDAHFKGPTKSIVPRAARRTSSTWIPLATKISVTIFNGDPIYDIEEGEDHALVFIGSLNFKVYPRVGLLPVTVYSNNTIEIGYTFAPWTVTTLSVGETTTISKTPIVVGTNAVFIGTNTLPLNLDAISSVSSAFHSSRGRPATVEGSPTMTSSQHTAKTTTTAQGSTVQKSTASSTTVSLKYQVLALTQEVLGILLITKLLFK